MDWAGKTKTSEKMQNIWNSLTGDGREKGIKTSFHFPGWEVNSQWNVAAKLIIKVLSYVTWEQVPIEGEALED